VELRRLGDSGLQVSAVGLGTNTFAGRLHHEAARAVLNEAFERGITFIDTADVCGRGSDDLARSGKVRYVGHSNFSAWQIADADWTARVEHLARPISAQMHYNLLNRGIQAEVIPACQAHGLGVIPYFPLESGFLTGKYRAGGQGHGRLAESARAGDVITPGNFERIGAFEAFATEKGHTLLDLAFGWLLTQPVVGSVIASASSPEQVKANVAAAEWRLSSQDMSAFSAL
jgi:aryl-alcohol dehydrogenase-like predicted oxidoreductase